MDIKNRKIRTGLKDLAGQGFKNTASKTIRKQFVSKKSRIPNRVIYHGQLLQVLTVCFISHNLPT